MKTSVLLFGGRGHLAKTKLIPALNCKKIKYIPLSRQKVEIFNEHHNIAFMSIPSQHVISCIKPYETYFKSVKPLTVLEKPH